MRRDFVYLSVGRFEERTKLVVRANEVGFAIAVDSVAQAPTGQETAQGSEEGLRRVIIHYLQVDGARAVTNEDRQECLVFGRPKQNRSGKIHASVEKQSAWSDTYSWQAAH